MLNNTNQFLRHLEHAYYQQFGGIPSWLEAFKVVDVVGEPSHEVC
jgi:hypothetical protein